MVPLLNESEWNGTVREEEGGENTYKLYQEIKGDCGSHSFGVRHLVTQVGSGGLPEMLHVVGKEKPMGPTPPEWLEWGTAKLGPSLGPGIRLPQSP